MGILERIEEKLDVLISREPSEVILGVISDTIEDDIPDFSDDIADDNADFIDTDNNGVVWDERIHTSNKGKTQKDIWKRKPGLDNDFFNDVMGELNSHTIAPTPPAKKGPPTKPTKKAPPTKKTPPTKSTGENFKGKALKDINMICKMHDASFEMVVANILEKHGIDTFDGLPENLHEEVSVDVSAWLESLKSVQSEMDALVKMSRDTEHSQDINDAVKVYIQEAGAEDSLLGSVPIGSLEGLRLELIEYSNQWAEFFKE